MKNITLEQMIKELMESLIKQEEPKTYYWKRLNYQTEKPEYIEITQVDLLWDRFKTIDDDFNYYEYELKESNIYREE